MYLEQNQLRCRIQMRTDAHKFVLSRHMASLDIDLQLSYGESFPD